MSTTKLGKKMVIVPFKVQPKVPESFEVETWSKLKLAVEAVFQKKAISFSKEELYQAVEDMCVHKLGPQLYEKLFTECQEKINQKVDSLNSQIQCTTTEFLFFVDNMWMEHCEQIHIIRNIFLYLDRSYALGLHQHHSSGTNTSSPFKFNGSNIKLIWNMANDFFRIRLNLYPDVEMKIIRGLLHVIETYRLHQSSQHENQIIGRIVDMLLTLDLYTQLFEIPFLEDSQRFFQSEGNELIHLCSPSDFLLHVEKRLEESVEMSHKYLNMSTKRPLLDLIDHYLLEPHTSFLIERGFSAFINEDRRSDLQRMYQLFGRIDGLDLLKTEWNKYIREQGESILHDGVRNNATTNTTNSSSGQSPPKEFVEEVLIFQEKLLNILKFSFANQESFAVAMRNSFEHFININQNNCAALMARYVDKKMKGEKGLTESDIEMTLEKVMVIFRYLQGKDVFEAFYKKHLAKRLLLGKSASYELEKSMLNKLKTECGSNFTSKLEGMFQDIEMSRECSIAFQQYLSQSPPSLLDHSSTMTTTTPSSSVTPNEPELAIQVLTTGYWPAAPNTDALRLPNDLIKQMDIFNTFYVGKYQGRRLVWAHHHERCIITARFPKGKKELEVSLYQALALNCFNIKDKMSFHELKLETGIEDGELRRTLQSLACGLIGTRILSKEPKGKEVNDEDVFFYNGDFTSKLFHIKINSIQVKETIEEVTKTNEEVFRDREYQVDAAIVRIMKSRKRLSHAMLISELMSQLRFPAQSSDLKKRIESLIEREYLERAHDAVNTYNYLA